ncbi:MAG: outer rane efflux protein [Candidatus Solibacter sp.]|nr:outer rane efflux protein [Candidatus Solibacter sp.]
MRPVWVWLFCVPLAAAPVELSLKRAVQLATAPDGNTRVQLTSEALKQTESRRLQSRASLLPDLSAAFTEQNLTRNLGAMGIRITSPIPGLQIPRFVGPFTMLDARVSATQSVFDISAYRRYQAAKMAVSAARSDVRGTEEQVAAQVARAYLAAVRADADVDVALANVALSEAVVKQAENQKTAGTGTGIEITRARVQLANDRQRLLVAENARRSAVLQLLRAIGLGLGTDVVLTDRLTDAPVDPMTLEQAKVKALEDRPDYQAQREREATARISASAVTLERVPTLSAFGDYGESGTGFNSSLPTRTVGISVRIPVFDGGRREARRAESASQARAETVRTKDLREQIELDVRLALDALRSAGEQVKVAKDGLELAENEMTQARRRYDAGVAVGLEVTDAQTRLARARDNQTTALYNYNVARIDLAQSVGAVKRMVE